MQKVLAFGLVLGLAACATNPVKTEVVTRTQIVRQQIPSELLRVPPPLVRPSFAAGPFSTWLVRVLKERSDMRAQLVEINKLVAGANGTSD